MESLMSRPVLLSLLAVCLAFGLLSPTPLPGVLDKIGLAYADDDDDDDDDDRRKYSQQVTYDRNGKPIKKKRKNFLEDIFDFG